MLINITNGQVKLVNYIFMGKILKHYKASKLITVHVKRVYNQSVKHLNISKVVQDILLKNNSYYRKELINDK